jgi:hypothetical protein
VFEVESAARRAQYKGVPHRPLQAR